MPNVFDWSTDPASNTTVDGININTGMPVGNVDNALRSIMALVRSTLAPSIGNFLNGSSALSVNSGGTGASDAATARSNLGIPSTQPIAQGGTGQTTAIAALAALGGLGVVSENLSMPGNIRFRTPSGGTFMIAWGAFAAAGNGSTNVNYTDAFFSFSVAVCGGTGEQSVGAQDNNPSVITTTTTGFSAWNANNACTAYYIAVGV